MAKKAGAGAGEFFALDLNTVYLLVRCEAKFNDICAYLILVRGSKAHGAARATAYGAQAISQRLNISRPRAEKHLRWLECANVDKQDFSFIRAFPDKRGELRPKNRRGVSAYRWMVHESSDPKQVYLPNSLCDGLKNAHADSPIAQLGQLSSTFDQNKDQLQTDALLILLRCYFYHDLDAFAGLDPEAVFYKLEELTNLDGESQYEIPNSDLVYCQIKMGGMAAGKNFVSNSLLGAVEAKVERFWQGFEALLGLGLLYRVTTVWSGDSGNDSSAEILYTLYVHDFHARQDDPYLQKEIHSFLLKKGALFAEDEFSYDGQFNAVGSGIFRFLRKSIEHKAIGIFRLRFRPRTRDTGIGMEAERKRVAEWSRELQQSSERVN